MSKLHPGLSWRSTDQEAFKPIFRMWTTSIRTDPRNDTNANPSYPITGTAD